MDDELGMEMLDYDVVDHVMQTWNQVRNLKPDTYKEDIGCALVRKLLEESKSAMNLFDTGDQHIELDELCASKRFIVLSVAVVTMMEMAINLLGPDMDLVTEQLLQLGGRHARFGVTRSQFEIVGDGLLIALEDALPPDMFLDKHKRSWAKFYGYVTDMMMEGERRKLVAGGVVKPSEKIEIDTVASSTADSDSSTGSIDGSSVSAAPKKKRGERKETTFGKMMLNIRLMLSGKRA